MFGVVQLTRGAERPALVRAHLAALTGFAITVLAAALGYLDGSTVPKGASHAVTGMAVMTMAGLVVLLAGVIAQRPDREPLRRLRGTRQGRRCCGASPPRCYRAAGARVPPSEPTDPGYLWGSSRPAGCPDRLTTASSPGRGPGAGFAGF